jgi:hypothetical protein
LDADPASFILDRVGAMRLCIALQGISSLSSFLTLYSPLHSLARFLAARIDS